MDGPGDFDSGKEETQWLFRTKIGSICFLWKGVAIYSATYDGKSTDFLVTLGHASWSYVLARERGTPITKEQRQKVCCQPGCREDPCSIYQVRSRYCRSCGNSSGIRLFKEGRKAVRAFCPAHHRRGDCGLDDSDKNYTLLAGLGPEGNEPNPEKCREAARGPDIVMGAE